MLRNTRVCLLLIGVVIAVLLALMLYRAGPHAAWLPGCMFHKLTGFDCPGCGMTRATHAALHGRILDAFRYNPLGMILLPAALIGLGIETLGWVRGKPLPVRFRIGGNWVWGIFGLLMAFWILRNIPIWPFTLLAPPA